MLTVRYFKIQMLFIKNRLVSIQSPGWQFKGNCFPDHKGRNYQNNRAIKANFIPESYKNAI